MRKFLSLLLALVLVISVFTITPINLNIGAASSKTLYCNSDLLKKVGKQISGSVACACYSLAYCRTMLDGKVHYYYEYNKGVNDEFNASAQWGSGNYYTVNAGNRTNAFKACYDSINNNRPIILHINNSYGQHWVAVVGYQNVTSTSSMTESNLLVIDPLQGYTGSPKTLSGYTLHSDYRYATTNSGSVANPHTTHNYNKYVYYWAAHPHYKCYECSCGEVKENRAEPTFISSCTTCQKSILYENIKPDSYFIKNKANGNYLNIAYGKNEDGTAIHTYEFGNYDSQVYNVYRVDNGYSMMPLCSKTRVINSHYSTIGSDKTVDLRSETNENSQCWKFEPVKDGYVIRSVKNPGMCLTPYNYAMIVSEYTGADNQIWYLEKACTLKYNANGGNGAPVSHRVRAGYKTVLSSQKPERKCHTFNGWSTAKDAKIASWDEKTSVTIYDNTNLYAVWSGKHTYTNTCDTICNACNEKRTIKHTYKIIKATKATVLKKGNIVKKCNVCNKVTNVAIYYPKSIKLSRTEYTYDGKTNKPSVKIYDSKGNKLEYGKDYTYSRPKSSKKVGKYTIKVTFKGNYSGTKNLYYEINPKGTKVSSVSAAKKNLKVKIKKQSTQTTGYQIQYSTSSKFKSAKTKTTKSISYTIKSLKAKKTYYVRVRTYKSINGKKYYSGWSTAVKKKTK